METVSIYTCIKHLSALKVNNMNMEIQPILAGPELDVEGVYHASVSERGGALQVVLSEGFNNNHNK